MNATEVFVRDPTSRIQIERALAIRNDDGTVPHVYCDGARFHVLSWSTEGRKCSHPDCVLNHPNTGD